LVRLCVVPDSRQALSSEGEVVARFLVGLAVDDRGGGRLAHRVAERCLSIEVRREWIRVACLVFVLRVNLRASEG
jgi:hypothetical protein